MGADQSMENHLFNLRFTSRQLVKEADKAEKSAVDNKLKCKKGMEKGNMDGARIYAESAIRDKNTALNYRRLSSRVDAVAQRVNTAVKMKTLTKDMSGIVKAMDVAMQSMDAVKITAVMDKFEKQFENLDLSTATMENAMQSSTAITTPENQVEDLMKEVADEHGLEFQSSVDFLPNTAGKKKVEKKEAGKEEEKEKVEVKAGAGGDDLEERLRRLQDK